MEPQVPWFQLSQQQSRDDSNRTEETGTTKGTHKGDNLAYTRRLDGEEVARIKSLPDELDRLLPVSFRKDALRTTRRMDSPKTTHVPIEAVEAT